MNKKCFIICPIGEDGSETRKRSDTVFDYLLTPVCEKMNYEIIRCDKISSSDKIDNEIIDYLDSVELVIADLTDLNPNVFYEAGYRKAKGLPYIQIALDGTKLPFDVSTIRTQFYSISDVPKYENFKTNLKKVIQTIENKTTKKATAIKTLNEAEQPSSPQNSLTLNIVILDVVFNVYMDRVLELLQKSFTLRLGLMDIFKIIGLGLIEENPRSCIERAINKFATEKYLNMVTQGEKEEYTNNKQFIRISDEDLNLILLKLIGLEYIIVHHPNHNNDYLLSTESTYVLTESGRKLLLKIT